MMEEGLATHIAEFKANFGDEDLETAAKSGRLVLLVQLAKPEF